jgi:hypothetical protein
MPDPIRIDTGKRKFEVTSNGETKLWEYDILAVKLMFEDVEKKHGLRKGNDVGAPTVECLSDIATGLQSLGLDGCSLDAAFRVYNVVNTQFRVLYASISEQVNSQANPPQRAWWEKLIGRR